MHIPDGYLSPSTCAAMYAAAGPFWLVALRKLERALSSRLVPLLSVFSAFSFVLMMFNIPLPGGTSGHAVGMAIAAVVLGPWAAVLAISVALGIQALFFGDGGITALGANCFNMGVAGSFVAYAIYRAVALGAPLCSPRRAVAAGLAGYGAINVSAVLTAVELGIQPALFRDAGGAPLYAPYPLSIALPAMMLGHVTIAGMAELTVSAGLVAWLQRTEPALLRMTAPDAPEHALAVPMSGNIARPLWAGLCGLMIATPLGLLAAGTAWGEWGAGDFRDHVARAEIVAASGGAPLPAGVPAGLDRLAHLWTAPIPDYAPAFLKSVAFGYLMSAMLGTGLILAACLAVARLARRAGGVSRPT